jgi:hypothetical protein
VIAALPGVLMILGRGNHRHTPELRKPRTTDNQPCDYNPTLLTWAFEGQSDAPKKERVNWKSGTIAVCDLHALTTAPKSPRGNVPGSPVCDDYAKFEGAYDRRSK